MMMITANITPYVVFLAYFYKVGFYDLHPAYVSFCPPPQSTFERLNQSI
jgi:hypothetical protein